MKLVCLYQVFLCASILVCSPTITEGLHEEVKWTRQGQVKQGAPFSKSTDEGLSPNSILQSDGFKIRDNQQKQEVPPLPKTMEEGQSPDPAFTHTTQATRLKQAVPLSKSTEDGLSIETALHKNGLKTEAKQTLLLSKLTQDSKLQLLHTQLNKKGELHKGRPKEQAILDQLYKGRPKEQAILDQFHKGRPRRQANLDELRECQRLTQQVQCTGGLTQRVVDLEARCNQSSVHTTSESCSRNSNGDYCDLARTYASDVNQALVSCAAIGECTEQCSNQLMLLRDRLGCCINTIYNNSLSILYTPGPFTYALWTGCSVPPPNETCSATTVSIPEAQIDPSCTTEVFASELNSLMCNTDYILPMLDAVVEVPSCEDYHASILEQCGVGEDGEPCHTRRNVLAEGFTATLRECGGAQSCAQSCMSALRDFFTTGGCCVNNIFNGSLSGVASPSHNFLSYEFVRECGLSSPGFCPTRFTRDETTQPDVTTVEATTRGSGVNVGPSVILTLMAIVITTLMLPH